MCMDLVCVHSDVWTMVCMNSSCVESGVYGSGMCTLIRMDYDVYGF